MQRLRIAIAGLTATLAALSALAVNGVFTRLDSYALDHWMPAFDPAGQRAEGTLPDLSGLYMPWSEGTPVWTKALSAVTYPASVLVSGVVFAAASALLLRRGRTAAALVVGGSWVLANGIEFLLKRSLERPGLSMTEDGAVIPIHGFDHAFPSGHTLRAVMLVGLVLLLWRRFALPVALWAVTVPPLLVVIGAHVPADVIGGLVYGLLVVGVTHGLAGASWLEERRAARRAP